MRLSLKPQRSRHDLLLTTTPGKVHRSGSTSVYTMSTSRRHLTPLVGLNCQRHGGRSLHPIMPECRPPYRLRSLVLYLQLPEGQQPSGCPRLCYKNTIMRNLKKIYIDTNSWKSLALQRDVWRDTVVLEMK